MVESYGKKSKTKSLRQQVFALLDETLTMPEAKIITEENQIQELRKTLKDMIKQEILNAKKSLKLEAQLPY